MQTIDFEVRGEYITLDALLKATGLASSGGGAKAMIADGKVQVDGREELRKTCKLRPGQVVGVHGTRVRVVAAATDRAAAGPSG
jgi:ribosome-associated protein